MPSVGGILEIALYVTDLQRASAFYRRLFGFAVLLESDRLIALDVAPHNVLLLFQQGATHAPLAVPGGIIPGHPGAAGGHFAFSIAAADVDEWKTHLASEQIAWEGEVIWPTGAHSLYFRDPDAHLVELMTPGFWANNRTTE